MSDRRIVVWVQHFADRPYLMLQWHDPETGSRKSKSAETCNPIDAEVKRADLEYELNNNLHARPNKMPWSRFRELFESEYFPNCRPDTRRVFTTVFNHFERLAKPRQLGSITQRTVSQFAAAIRKQPGRIDKSGWSPWTVKVRLQFLRTALNWAVGQGLLQRCPAFPEVRAPKVKPKPVPLEPFERLLDKADPQTRAFLLCGWLAGLRRKEAVLLEWEETDAVPWVDFGRSRIWLPAGFVKGVEDQWLPLDPVLADALGALDRRGKRVFHFYSKVTGEPLTLSGVSLKITKLAKSAGVKLSMKTLRKGFGSRYAGKVPAQVLQRLMRHSNISITMDFYANVDEAVEAAVLGDRRNSSRNRPAGSDVSNEHRSDANAVH